MSLQFYFYIQMIGSEVKKRMKVWIDPELFRLLVV